MSELMNKLYYMVEEQTDQECTQDEERKILLRRKCALIDEIIFRLGAGGEDLMDGLTDLDAQLKDIYNKALFQVSLSLGIEAAGSRRGWWATE